MCPVPTFPTSSKIIDEYNPLSYLERIDGSDHWTIDLAWSSGIDRQLKFESITNDSDGCPVTYDIKPSAYLHQILYTGSPATFFEVTSPVG